jgi:hypothetical protein
MQKDSTQNHIILNAYRELDVLNQLELIERLETDSGLKQFEAEVIGIKEQLDCALASAHPTSIKIILEEAAKSAPEALEEF